MAARVDHSCGHRHRARLAARIRSIPIASRQRRLRLLVPAVDRVACAVGTRPNLASCRPASPLGMDWNRGVVCAVRFNCVGRSPGTSTPARPDLDRLCSLERLPRHALPASGAHELAARRG